MQSCNNYIKEAFNYPSNIDSNKKKYIKNSNEEESEKLINSLINKKINLKGFIFLASPPYISQVEQTIFRKTTISFTIMLDTLIDNDEFPKYITTTTLIQLMLDGKTYLD